jgi:hypothetical protein
MPFVKGESIRLGLLPQADPHHRSTLLVHFQHMAARLRLVETEDLLEDQDNVRHQVHRVVQNDDAPSPAKGKFGMSRAFRLCAGRNLGHKPVLNDSAPRAQPTMTGSNQSVSYRSPLFLPPKNELERGSRGVFSPTPIRGGQGGAAAARQPPPAGLVSGAACPPRRLSASLPIRSSSLRAISISAVNTAVRNKNMATNRRHLLESVEAILLQSYPSR